MPCSFLFVPGDRPERFAKALASGAGQIVIDLEDAVGAEAKDFARDTLAGWLSNAPPEAAGRVVVRINGANTPWFEADCAIVAAEPGVTAVMMPKADASSPWEALLDKPVLALIETAAGIDDLRSVARATNVRRLVFGSIDLQLDLGIDGDGEELLFFRSQLVLASRLAGLPPPVDGVCLALADTQALSADVRRARRLGFGGKLCIHPAQVATVEAGFAPSAAEMNWATRVLEAAAQASGAAVALDGQMIDLPVILRARRLLGLVDHERQPIGDRSPPKNA